MAFVLRSFKYASHNKSLSLPETWNNVIFVSSRAAIKPSLCSVAFLPSSQYSTIKRNALHYKLSNTKYFLEFSALSLRPPICHFMSTDSNEKKIGDIVSSNITQSQQSSESTVGHNPDAVSFVDMTRPSSVNRNLDSFPEPIQATSSPDASFDVSAVAPSLSGSIEPSIESAITTNATEIFSVVDAIEPSLASQGLGGWSPIGLLQQCLEFFHVNMGMPWWLSIVTVTIIVRTVMLPLIVKSQKNAVNMNNNLPQMQILQAKLTEARKSGNALEAARYSTELMMFMKEKNLNPLKNLIVPLVQAPVFISFFIGMRRMANLPVESMKTGGYLWFSDLTIPDPYFIMPIITSATLFLTLEIGVDSGIRAGNMQITRYVLRAMPIVIFPFTINFPSAVLCYWMTTNLISLIQVSILKIEPVRDFFKIPKLVRHDSSALPLKKGFVEGIKESYTNQRIVREIEDRSRIDSIRFRKAGTGPIQKTYSYDPTKPRPAAAAAAAAARKVEAKRFEG